MEFIDGGTGQVVAEFADTALGQKYVLDASKGVTSAVTASATNYLDAYSTWAYAQQAFDRWSAQFRKFLDQVNGRASPA